MVYSSRLWSILRLWRGSVCCGLSQSLAQCSGSRRGVLCASAVRFRMLAFRLRSLRLIEKRQRLRFAPAKSEAAEAKPDLLSALACSGTHLRRSGPGDASHRF